MKKSAERTGTSHLRVKAEAVQKKRAAGTSSHPSEADTKKLLHELEVHQIELEMQNDELERARAAANELAEKFIELYDHAPTGYVTLSADGQILQLNFACARMLGKERSRLMNNLFPFFVSGESRPAFELFVQKALEGKGNATCEVALSMNDASTVFVYLTGSASKEKDKIFITATDITERKQADAELRRLYEQTQRDAAIKTELLNEVNHRVKNNLMMILGLIVAEERRASEGGSNVDVWEKFERRLNGLLQVHQMLSESKWEPIALDQLAERICTSVIGSGGNAEQPVELQVEESDIKVSPRQAGYLALVFNELITNCLKYAFASECEPRIRVSTGMQDDRIFIRFQDNGGGYPEEVLQRSAWNVGLRLINEIIEGTLDGKVLLSNENGAVIQIFLGGETDEERKR